MARPGRLVCREITSDSRKIGSPNRYRHLLYKDQKSKRFYIYTKTHSMALQPSLHPQVILGPLDAPHTLDLFCVSLWRNTATNIRADFVH